MNNPLTKTLLLLCAATVVSLSSFTLKEKNVKSPNSWEEYNQVIDYVRDNVCTPIAKSNGQEKVKFREFSRCPSGYQPQVAGHHDSAKVDRYVYGKVTLYSGCSGKHVCDFKVHVNKDITLIKSRTEKEYTPVSDWIAAHKKADLPPVQEKKAEVKG